MKKQIIAIAVIFHVACNSHKTEQVKFKSEIKEIVEQDKKLQLNNGKRWQLDSLTRKNVSIIQKLLTDSNVNQKRKILVDKLQQQVDRLVGECKMTGADHEALHQWLEIFLKNLREVKVTEKSQESWQVLQKDMDQFYLYFE